VGLAAQAVLVALQEARMHKYAISLRPVVAAGGIDALDESRRLIFQGAVLFMSKLIQSADEVSSSVVTDDYTIVVEATQDVSEVFKKLGDKVIVTKL